MPRFPETEWPNLFVPAVGPPKVPVLQERQFSANELSRFLLRSKKQKQVAPVPTPLQTALYTRACFFYSCHLQLQKDKIVEYALDRRAGLQVLTSARNYIELLVHINILGMKTRRL